jgi:hypothetical protein
MFDGRPGNLHTPFRNIQTKFVAFFSPSFNGMTCAIFVKRSMITHTDDNLSDTGNSIIKSKEIESHGL